MIPNNDVLPANNGKHYLRRREVEVRRDGTRREVGRAGSSLGVEAASREASAALGLADVSAEAVAAAAVALLVGTVFRRNAPHGSPEISRRSQAHWFGRRTVQRVGNSEEMVKGKTKAKKQWGTGWVNSQRSLSTSLYERQCSSSEWGWW